jgi:hypothetical protein
MNHDNKLISESLWFIGNGPHPNFLRNIINLDVQFAGLEHKYGFRVFRIIGDHTGHECELDMAVEFTLVRDSECGRITVVILGFVERVFANQ